MKERFLNIFLFLISLLFITSGIVLIFFYNIDILKIVHENFNKIFTDGKLAVFFIQLFGTFIFSWGVFFFLMTVFTVMELKNTSVYGFIFWVYTFWALSFGYVLFINNYKFLLIVTAVIYGIIFLPFLLSIPMKSSGGSSSSKEMK